MRWTVTSRVLVTSLLLLTLQFHVITSLFQSSSGIPSEFQLVEEMPAGTLVGSVRDNPQLLLVDSDVDTDSLRYAIRQQPSPLIDYFTVDEQSGQIRTRLPVDRERVCLPRSVSCRIVFDVVLRPLNYFQIVRVIVHIQDINDNIPTFPQQQLTLHIGESTRQGSKFSMPAATDADSGLFGIQGFELASTSVDMFALTVKRNVDESFDLRLQLTGELDREMQSQYQLTVVAFDGGQPRRSGTLSIDIVVIDANDHCPQFTSDIYQVEIMENELPSSAIVRVEATDADEGQNSQLVYSLSEFSDIEYGDVFRVDSVTGEVFLRRRLDREVESLYSVSVCASDRGSPALTAFSQVIVTVQDDNDNVPSIVVSSASADEQLRVSENSEPDTFIAYVSASDNDLGSAGQVYCYVEGRQFSLESLYDSDAESEYKLLTSTTFDREVQPTVLVTLTCSDRGHPTSLSAAVELVVEVTDNNDHSPLIDSQKYELSLAEGNEIGAEIVRINATDMDIGRNAELRFAMTRVGRTPDRGLSINETTGCVTADISLDYETCHLYHYTVSVADLGDVPRTSSASLVLHVTDTDDERPQFHRPAYYFNVLEDVPVGTVIGRVLATDSDRSSAFSTVTYHIRDDAIPFSIDDTSGQLSTVRQLNREERSVYQFTVTTADTLHETTALVTVYVQDVNDNAPVIRQRSSIVTAPFNLPPASLITRMDAKDPDEGENGRVSYWLSHGNDEGLFDVDQLTGAVTSTRRLPSTPTEYQLVITAHDHGSPVHVAVVDLIVVVNGSTAAGRQADSSLFIDDRLVVSFGLVCGVLVVTVLALIVCSLLVLRRHTTTSQLKSSCDDSDRQTRVITDNCVTSEQQWTDEYSNMINEICVKTPSTGSVASSASHSATCSSSVLASAEGRRCSRCVRGGHDDDDDVTNTSLSTSSRRVMTSSPARRKRSRDTVNSSPLSSTLSVAGHRHAKMNCDEAVCRDQTSALSSCRDSGLVLHDVPRCRRHHHHHTHQATDTQHA